MVRGPETPADQVMVGDGFASYATQDFRSQARILHQASFARRMW